METGGLLELAGHQPSCRLSERLYLKVIWQGVTEQGFYLCACIMSMHVCAHVRTYTQVSVTPTLSMILR